MDIAALQQHYLENTIDKMPDGVQKEAALEAFRTVAFRTPKSEKILKRNGGM